GEPGQKPVLFSKIRFLGAGLARDGPPRSVPQKPGIQEDTGFLNSLSGTALRPAASAPLLIRPQVGTPASPNMSRGRWNRRDRHCPPDRTGGRVGDAVTVGRRHDGEAPGAGVSPGGAGLW